MMQTSRVSHAERALRSERIDKLVKYLSDGVYEREHTIKLCLLAALSGESVFLLGPPGIAKSLIAKRLINAFETSTYFEYLMTRFSTPEEVFGPLSIQELKDNGRYVRLTDGYLPKANVVFLDEIWKAGPAILNTLLTVVNEKTFKNGNDIEKVPMRLLISASNELPDEDSGLEALYDRMLVRIFVNRIQDKRNFFSMLTVGTTQEAEVPDDLKISNQEYSEWLSELDQLPLSEELFDKLYLLKSMLEERHQESETTLKADDLYVSDRRWKKAVKLLKASAFFNGRQKINALDLILIQDCLWNSPESRVIVREVMRDFALNHAFGQSDILHVIESSKRTLEDVQAEIEVQNSLQVAHEAAGGLLRKEGFKLDLNDWRVHKVGPTGNLVKLVLLQSNLSVSEQEKGDSRWVYVPHNDLVKVVSQGGGDVYGYVNQNTNMVSLKFALDADDNLVIKDIANRSVLVGLVTNKGLDSETHQKWHGLAQSAVEDLEKAELTLTKVRSDFHGALPHNFIEPELPTAMESGLQNLADSLVSAQSQSKKLAQRIGFMADYYSE
ncbi:putative regulator protein [Vibrio ishigakensis]|uniref:Putative regulator protein n=1 Tax=Vibrio ishigakensis TaxID=1481914 RepID=A0A0B8QGC7_9VIBR|nr:regulator protein [Vibrio sp. JCM 19236]GAM74208.1 putative regulator protein [Vibrio ishigakensis]